MKNRKIIPLALYLLVMFATFSWLGNLFSSSGNTIPYSEVVSLFRQATFYKYLQRMLFLS